MHRDLVILPSSGLTRSDDPVIITLASLSYVNNALPVLPTCIKKVETMLPRTRIHHFVKLVLTVVAISVLIVLIWSFATSYAQNEDRNVKLYWAEKVTDDGKLVFREYDLSSVKAIDVSDLEIWSEKVNTRGPLPLVHWDEVPDFKLELLRYGRARLRDESSAPDEYIQAQNQAKSGGLGMWPEPRAKKTVTIPSWSQITKVLFGLISLYGGLKS